MLEQFLAQYRKSKEESDIFSSFCLDEDYIIQNINKNKSRLRDIITQNITHYLETRTIFGLHFLAVIFDWFREPAEIKLLKTFHQKLSTDETSPISFDSTKKTFFTSSFAEEFISGLNNLLPQSYFRPRAFYISQLLEQTINEFQEDIEKITAELNQGLREKENAHFEKMAEEELLKSAEQHKIEAKARLNQLYKAGIEVSTKIGRLFLPKGALELAGVGYIAATSETPFQAAKNLVTAGVKTLVPGGTLLHKFSDATSNELTMEEKNELRAQAISEQFLKYTGAVIGGTLGSVAGPAGIVAGGFFGKHIGEYTGALAPKLLRIRGPIDLWNLKVGAKIINANSESVSVIPDFEINQYWWDNDSKKILSPLRNLYLKTEIELKNLIVEMKTLNDLDIDIDLSSIHYQEIRDYLRGKYNQIKTEHVATCRELIKTNPAQNQMRIKQYNSSLAQLMNQNYHEDIVTQLQDLDEKLACIQRKFAASPQ